VSEPVHDDLASPPHVGPLRDGLVRRWSTAADAPELARLMGVAFREKEDELPNPRAVHQALLMMRPGFPYMTPADAAVVEDTSRGDRPLVACTVLWRHRWTFARIPFGVTRPETVATDPAYRRRGLIRAVFEMVHARGAAEGHLLSAITGIPYFYRQFEYEYVLYMQLLLGYRSLDELSALHPDVGAKDEERLLIATLFPRQPSRVEPLG
jgi:GNAT superfamily N-acetyltransferase